MHNHDWKNGGRMMWMMIPCLILLGVLLFGGGKLASSGGYFWPVIIGVFVVAHVWMMLKGHGGHNGIDTDEKTKNEHESGGCCH